MMKPGYKQTEIGIIPEDWEIKSLPSFGDVVSGGTPSTSVSEYWDGDIAWCTPSDITRTKGTTIAKTERYITVKGLANSAAALLPPGCVLLCTRATIGDSKINSVAMATNQGFKNIIPKNCNITFLFYLLQTKKQEMLEKAIGSTFLEISKSALCSIPLQYPPIPEQQRIAEALSDMDELIASLEKLIAKKKAIKQGAMQELLTGKRRLPGFSGEWTRQAMGGYAAFIVGYPFSSTHFNEKAIGLRLIRNRDLKSDDQIIYSSEKVNPAYIVENGDVLVGMDGDFLPCIWKKGRALLNQRVGKLLFSTSLNNRFAYYAFQKPLSELQDGTGATTVKHLSHGDIKKLFVLIPPTKDEQKAVATILSDIDEEIQRYEERVRKAQQIKQSMMQQLLTGQIRLL